MAKKWVPGDPSRRLIISCPAPLRAALEDMADATGKPVATVARGILEEMIPNLHDLAKYFRHIRHGEKSAAKRALQHSFGNAMAEMMTVAVEQQELPLTKKSKAKRGA